MGPLPVNTHTIAKRLYRAAVWLGWGRGRMPPALQGTMHLTFGRETELHTQTITFADSMFDSTAF